MVSRVRAKVNTSPREFQDESCHLAGTSTFGGLHRPLFPCRAEAGASPSIKRTRPLAGMPGLVRSRQLQLNLCSQKVQELGQPFRVCWPGRCSDQVAVYVGFVHRNVHPLAPCVADIRANRRVGCARLSCQHPRRSEHLRSVTDRRDRLVLLSLLSVPSRFGSQW